MSDSIIRSSSMGGWGSRSIVMKMKLLKLLASTPVYPHWLEFRRTDRLKSLLISELSGMVLEVGAGEGRLKMEALSVNGAISRYITTDYSSWDEAFAAGEQLGQSERVIDLLHFRGPRRPLDGVCSALELPYASNSFDCHISMEVLEHVADPFSFFAEAARVVKPGGKIALTAPFLYRIHPDDSADFFRLLPGGYRVIADKFGLTVEKIMSNTGIGATGAALINQWMIRQYFNPISGIIWRIFLMVCMPLVFCLTNILGWLVDRFRPDVRFASRFLVVMRKT